MNNYCIELVNDTNINNVSQYNCECVSDYSSTCIENENDVSNITVDDMIMSAREKLDIVIQMENTVKIINGNIQSIYEYLCDQEYTIKEATVYLENSHNNVNHILSLLVQHDLDVSEIDVKVITDMQDKTSKRVSKIVSQMRKIKDALHNCTLPE
jgi:hypothetical protein